MTPDYRAALLDLAKELDEGVEFQREQYLSAFPGGDHQFMARAAISADVFQKLATMLRQRAEQPEPLTEQPCTD